MPEAYSEEPDHLAEMRAEDPRRRPPLTEQRMAEIATQLGIPLDVVRSSSAQRRANWEASEDPEGYWYTDADVEAIIEAAPGFDRG